MSAITTPKVHHFYPLAYNRSAKIRSPRYGSPTSIPEVRRTLLPMGTTSYVFGADAAPMRVDDIFLEALVSKRILPNRHAQKYVGQTKVVNDGRELFDYDPAQRKITFVNPLGEGVNMIWIDMRKARMWNDEWNEGGDFSIRRMLIQGTNYIDEALIPPDETQLTGKFQGGFRCYPEIVSMPKHGVVKLSDDLLGFSYRGKLAFTGKDSFEYLIYNALGQVSDVNCFDIQVS